MDTQEASTTCEESTHVGPSLLRAATNIEDVQLKTEGVGVSQGYQQALAVCQSQTQTHIS